MGPINKQTGTGRPSAKEILIYGDFLTSLSDMYDTHLKNTGNTDVQGRKMACKGERGLDKEAREHRRRGKRWMQEVS